MFAILIHVIKASTDGMFAVIMTDPQNAMRRQLLRLASCHYFLARHPSLLFHANLHCIKYKTQIKGK